MKTRIRELLHAQPFQPFIIRMADGREYRVEHPEFALSSQNETTPVVVEELGGGMHELWADLITSVEILPKAAA